MKNHAMKSRLTTRTALFLLLSLFMLNAAAQDISSRRIDSIVTSYRAKKPITGLIIGIVSNGSTQVFSYGETEKGNGVRPDTTTLFELGSLTQVFTTAIYADMVNAQLINAEDPLQKYMPAGVTVPMRQGITCRPGATPTGHQEGDREVRFTPYICFPDPASRPQDILLCDLATHTSGLDAQPGNLKSGMDKKNPYGNYPAEQLHKWLSGITLIGEQFPDFLPSDAGMALLGEALVQKGGRPYDELLQARIGNRFNLRTTKTILDAQDMRHLAKGYTAKGEAAPYWSATVMAPATGLHASMSDLLRFAEASVGSTGKPVDAALEYTHTARVHITVKKTEEDAGLGWMIKSLGAGQYKVTWQEGRTGGFDAYIGMVETTRTSVVILSNTSTELHDLGETILRSMHTTSSTD